LSANRGTARSAHAPTLALAQSDEDDAAPRDHVLTFRGQKLFVRECGHGNPILLINGLGANVEMWRPVEKRLSQVGRTISFDAPGMGRSRTSPIVLTHPMLAAMVCRVLDALEVDRCDVIGYSFGGTVAQQLARQAPQRVRRMALVGTSCGWGSIPPTPRAFALIATPARYYSRMVLEETSHLLDGARRDHDSELLRAQADARLQYPPTMTGYAQQFLAGSTWSSLHWISTIRTPTLVLAGGRDRLVPPANGALLSNRLYESRLQLLPGEGHLMLFDPRSAAHDLLVDFFSSGSLDESEAWLGGEMVDDDALSDALRDAEGAQPIKAMSSVYRRWVGLPAVQRLADELHLVHRR
jgi:pimeloyl-ACP methyl ester carboxylesterase